MATIFGKSNNYIKTEFFLSKVNHFKLLPVPTKNYLRRRCNTSRCDANKRPLYLKPLLFIGALKFLKNHRRRDQDFLVKRGGGRRVYRKREGKHCFSLIMHGFCISNALYSVSLSFRMVIFLFDSFCS